MKDEKYWEDLGRRAVACEGWRWMPGMLAVVPSDGDCTARLHGDVEWPWEMKDSDAPREWDEANFVDRNSFDGAWPDFRDPATVGCLLALVREGFGFDARPIRTDHGTKWVVVVGLRSCDVTLPRDTEAEAIVAALGQVGP